METVTESCHHLELENKSSDFYLFIGQKSYFSNIQEVNKSVLAFYVTYIQKSHHLPRNTVFIQMNNMQMS